MGNTGYKSYANLELYYLDDNSPAGEIKANTYGTVGYIAPTYDPAACVPSVRYYNEARTSSATKNDCSSGYTGSSVMLTANANQFVSAISVEDANAQADAWLAANAQVYANNLGTCTINGDQIAPSVPGTPNYSLFPTYTGDDDSIKFLKSTDNVGVDIYEIFVSKNGVHLLIVDSSIIFTGYWGGGDNGSEYYMGFNNNYFARTYGTGNYGFKVRAKDTAGNVSDFSTEVFYSMNSETPGGHPTSLSATNIASTTFTLNWVASTYASTYRIFKDNVLYATVGNVTTYNLTGLVAGSTSSWSIEGEKIPEGFYSQRSNLLSVTMTSSFIL